MPIEDTQIKLDIIADLQKARDVAARQFLPLVLAGLTEEANAIRSKTRAITQKIDRLIGDSLDVWTGESDEISNELRKAYDRILEGIRELDEKTTQAEGVATLLKNLDRVIAAATAIAT